MRRSVGVSLLDVDPDLASEFDERLGDAARRATVLPALDLPSGLFRREEVRPHRGVARDAIKALAEDGVLRRGDDGWTLSHGSRGALARGAEAWASHTSPASAVLIELAQDISRWTQEERPRTRSAAEISDALASSLDERLANTSRHSGGRASK